MTKTDVFCMARGPIVALEEFLCGPRFKCVLLMACQDDQTELINHKSPGCSSAPELCSSHCVTQCFSCSGCQEPSV